MTGRIVAVKRIHKNDPHEFEKLIMDFSTAYKYCNIEVQYQVSGDGNNFALLIAREA